MHYKDLEIWQQARGLVRDIHLLSLQDLPKFELYETGSQIRRSSKSIKSNIVEGFGRRKYKLDFIHFLIYAEASADETLDHLETLFETGSLKNEEKYQELHKRLLILGKTINNFIKTVTLTHRT